MSRPGAVALAFGLLAGLANAQEGPVPLEPATLERPESPVIVQGARLQKLLGASIDSLRLYAWKGDGLRAVAFQIDERTPQEGYAYHHGQQRTSDTDERRLDTNDEVIFMARDVGARVDVDAIRLGQAELAELRVRDPSQKNAVGWVYLLRFETAPPPPSDERYLTLDIQQRELRGWQGPTCQVVGPPWGSNLLDLRQLRFADARGRYGEGVLDRAKLSFQGSYLFLRLDRRLEEVNAKILGYLFGPIRLVADYQLQVYMIWGHWIETTRARFKLYHNRIELDAVFSLPVTLEKAPKSSELRCSLDFLKGAGPLSITTDKNLTGLPSDGRPLEGRKIDRGLPAWVCASLPGGSVLARLELPEHLRGRKHRLFLADADLKDSPEDEPGSNGNAGFSLDMTGLEAKADYSLRLVLQFGPPVGPGRPEALLRVDDAPLVAEVKGE